MAGEEGRPRSPPPSYEEAINDRPPPAYSAENPNPERSRVAQARTRSQRIARVSPIVTNPDNPDNVIVSQPRRQNDELARRADRTEPNGTSQHRKKRLGCNCLCSALRCTPCTCDCELFCFNCLGFLSYLLLCAPGVYLCWGCKKLFPETCGECCTRNTSLMNSYEDRDDNIVSRACWCCLGPCCCFTCDADTEVLPCSDPCVRRCGVCAVLKKMTCYCGSYKLCDYNLNVMDEQAFGFICDCKEVGFQCGGTT